jgi:hypothetical protein
MRSEANVNLSRQPSSADWFKTPIRYKDLNARQKENYNFLKFSAILADFGFVTMRVSADWEGADFIAQHNDGTIFLKVQLKGRLTLSKKYMDKDIYIAFRDGNGADACWYLFPHDEVLARVLAERTMGDTECWREKGSFSFRRLSEDMKRRHKPYQVLVPRK